MARTPRARHDLGVAREQDHKDACGGLPGGWQAYRFKPASCLPLSRRSSRKVMQRRAIASNRSHLQQQVYALQRRVIALDNTTHQMMRDAEEDKVRPIRGVSATDAMAAANMFNEMLLKAPEVIQQASMQMIDQNMIAQHPDPDLRYKHIVRQIDEIFESYAPVQSAVYKIAIAKVTL